jgi:putative phosphoesterase
MRLAVLADVHGNLPALEAVLADIQRNKVDGIIVAGDLAVSGPQPVEAVNCLCALGAWMIRGNTDISLLKYDAGVGPAAWRTSRVFTLLRWTHRHVDRETLDFLASLPEQRVIALPGADTIRVVHGSPSSPTESIFSDRNPEVFEHALQQVSEPVLVCGHTHLPWHLERDGRLIVNPGAVNGPLNGETGAQYAILAWSKGYWQPRLFTIPYDLERLRKTYRDSGFLEEVGPMARAFLLNLESGRDAAGDFFAYAKKLAAEAGSPVDSTVPDEVWEQAAAVFDWGRYKKK